MAQTVSTNHPDMDGHWLTLLRQHIGYDLPLIGTFDPHANLSPAMVEATDALIAYRTNPHLDQRERGIEAAMLMASTLRGEVKPTQAAAFPPLAMNIESQHTPVPPCLPLYELANQQFELPRVISNSIILGFPYADVAEMGSSTLVVTDNDPALAQALAKQLANYLWNHRQEFDPQLLGIDQALDQATQLEGPICLLDMGDNVGGGSPADATSLAQAIIDRKIPNSFVCLYDPEAVETLSESEIGAQCTLPIGGKTDNLHGLPIEVPVTLQSLHDGQYSEPEPRHGGFTHVDQGRTAVVQNRHGADHHGQLPPHSAF